jgi:hypothetical protein
MGSHHAGSPSWPKAETAACFLFGCKRDFFCTFSWGDGWDEAEQLFAPKRRNLIRQQKSVVRPSSPDVRPRCPVIPLSRFAKRIRFCNTHLELPSPPADSLENAHGTTLAKRFDADSGWHARKQFYGTELCYFKTTMPPL